MMHTVTSLLKRRSPRSTKRSTHAGRAKRAVLGGLAALCLAAPTIGHAQLFSNPASIDIPVNTLTQGQSSLYPAPITVSGAGTNLTSLSVTFLGLTHAYPGDIDVLLVGPGGQNVLLMSDAGDFRPISGLNLTFSDSATALLPQNAQIVSGTFRPTNYDAPGTTDSFAPPAPVLGPYGSALSVFNGTNPNGTWNLYVLDDVAGNNGVMAGGWQLNVAAVPEPSSLVFGAVAMAGAGVVALRRRAAAKRA